MSQFETPNVKAVEADTKRPRADQQQRTLAHRSVTKLDVAKCLE